MPESVEKKMGRIFRELFLQAFRDGVPEERRGEISRSRFDRAVSKAIGCKNVKRNTNGYWGTAQTLGLITMSRPDPLSGQLQTFDRAVVRADVWARDGFILEEGQQLEGMMTAGVTMGVTRSRKHKETVTLEELI